MGIQIACDVSCIFNDLNLFFFLRIVMGSYKLMTCRYFEWVAKIYFLSVFSCLARHIIFLDHSGWNNCAHSLTSV